MAEKGTISGTFELDTKPARESVDDLKRHVEKQSAEIKKLTSGATAGGGGPGGGMPTPPTPPTGGGGGAGAAVGAIAGLVGGATALLGGEVIRRMEEIGRRIIEARQEAEALDTRIHNLQVTANKSGGFEGIDEMRSSLNAAVKEADDLSKKLAPYNIKGNLAGQLELTRDAALHGQTPGAYKSGLEEKEQAARKAASEMVSKIAEKITETNKIEHDRFRVSEEQAQLGAEEIKHKETLNILSAEANRTGKLNLATTDAENERHKEAVNQIKEENAAIRGQEQTRQRLLDIQRRSAVAVSAATTSMERQDIVARSALESAKEQLANANEAVEATKDQGIEARRAAQARQTEAATGVTKAAAGVAGAEAAEFEAGANEYSMTNAQKGSQYNQRFEQYKTLQRYADKTGRDRNMITKPQMGAVEYDPMAGFKAARTAELAEQAQREARQRSDAMAIQKRMEIERVQAGKSATEAGIDINNPNVDVSKLAEIQRNKEAANATPVQGYQGGGDTAHQMDSAPWRFGAEFRNRPLRGDTTATGNMDLFSQIEPPKLPQAASQALPSPPSEASGGLADKVAAAVAAVMREFWSR